MAAPCRVDDPPAVQDRIPRWALPAGAVLALGGIATYLWFNDPHDPGSHLPGCPIRALTGLLCPGCGGLRASWDLMHGDLSHAWHDNPAVFVMLPALAIALLVWVRRRVQGAPAPRLHPMAALAFGLAGVGWMIARNVGLSA